MRSIRIAVTPARRGVRSHWKAVWACICLASVLSALPASAADRVGFYVGTAAADARYAFQVPFVTFPDVPSSEPAVKLKDTQWTARFIAGWRPWKRFGFEVSYADWRERQVQGAITPIAVPLTWFIYPIGAQGPQTTRVRLKTGTASGLGFLPLGQRVEAFAKVGLVYHEARYHSTENYLLQCPPGYFCPAIVRGPLYPFVATADQTARATNFTYAAGLQVHFGPVALRAEHERLQIDRGAYMTSLGWIWTFW